MDGDGGNDECRPIEIDQFGNECSIFRNDDTACCRQGAVEPGGHDHAAVAFHVQPDIRSVAEFGIFFDFKRGRVAMACRYSERMTAVFRDGKCHEGGAVSCDDIFPASFNLPRVFFPYFRKTCIRKRRPNAVYSMKNRRCFGNEVEQVAVYFFINGVHGLLLMYFSLVDRFCHLCAFTDNGIGGVDGGRGEVALIMEFLCGLFHFFHLDGSGGSVIDISISAGAVRKLFYRNEFQYVVAIGGRLVPCFSKVNGNGFAVLPQFFSGNRHGHGCDDCCRTKGCQ